MSGSESSGRPMPQIHMFWHGAPLGRIERVCISSFVAQGHEVQMHVYDDIPGMPAGVKLVDANLTLPRSQVFRHAKSGSLAPFADWFRYRVLYAHGGIWADTDVVCLKPLALTTAQLFAWQDEQVINNAVLGFERHHPLAHWMATCCEEPNRLLPYDSVKVRRRKLKRKFLQGNRRGNIGWGEYGPYGLTRAAQHLGYAEHALPFWHFYPVHPLNWRTVFDGSLSGNTGLLSDSSALHLWNEVTRRTQGFDRNARFPAHSLFETLCRRYLTSESEA